MTNQAASTEKEEYRTEGETLFVCIRWDDLAVRDLKGADHLLYTFVGATKSEKKKAKIKADLHQELKSLNYDLATFIKNCISNPKVSDIRSRY